MIRWTEGLWDLSLCLVWRRPTATWLCDCQRQQLSWGSFWVVVVVLLDGMRWDSSSSGRVGEFIMSVNVEVDGSLRYFCPKCNSVRLCAYSSAFCGSKSPWSLIGIEHNSSSGDLICSVGKVNFHRLAKKGRIRESAKLNSIEKCNCWPKFTPQLGVRCRPCWCRPLQRGWAKLGQFAVGHVQEVLWQLSRVSSE